jgi:hypothetical protein
VAAGRYVTGQKFSGSQPEAFSGPGRARAGFRVRVTGAGGRDHGGEPDHVPARLRGPGLSQSTFVLSSNRARVWGNDGL